MKAKALYALIASCCGFCTVYAQETVSSTRSYSGSSQDWWDKRFHPEKYKARQAARLEEWYKKWETSLCTADHVKEYWLLTLLIPEPSSLSSDYKAIAAHNDRIKFTIERGDVDFDAADLADQINVEYLTESGRTAEANAIESRRQERIRQYEEFRRQQEFEARIAAREAALQAQIDLLAQKVKNAQRAAAAAQSETQRLEREQQWNEQQQRTKDFMNR
jgi:hypothetical protein